MVCECVLAAAVFTDIISLEAFSLAFKQWYGRQTAQLRRLRSTEALRWQGDREPEALRVQHWETSMDQVVLRQSAEWGVGLVQSLNKVCMLEYQLTCYFFNFFTWLVRPTRLSSHLGEVGNHVHGVAREMAANPVDEALPPFLQRRGSHGSARENIRRYRSVPSNQRSGLGFPLCSPVASAGGVREIT